MTVPSSWRWETIDEIAAEGTFVDGDWVETKDQDSKGEVRLTQLADVGVAEFRDRSDRWMRLDQAERLGCTYLKPNDILIARMPEPLGRACLVPEGIGTAVTAVDVAILSVRRDDVEPRYVMWALNAPQTHQQVVAQQSGTTRKRISRRNLGTVRLPIPPPPEQRRIVAILEDHLSRLDAAHASLRHGLARLIALRASIINDALRAASRDSAGDRIRFGAVELPLPSSWRSSTVGEEAEVVEYGSGAKASEVHTIGSIPVLRMGNVKDGRIAWDSLKYLPSDHPDVAKLRLERGDLLFNRTNSAELVGKSAVFDGNREATFASYLIRARFKDSVNPRWANFVINSLYGRAYVKSVVSQQVGQANVNGTKLRAFPLPVPPRDVQDELVNKLVDEEDAAIRTSAQIHLSTKRIEALRRSVLTSAFSGNLTGGTSSDDLIQGLASV